MKSSGWYRVAMVILIGRDALIVVLNTFFASTTLRRLFLVQEPLGALTRSKSSLTPETSEEEVSVSRQRKAVRGYLLTGFAPEFITRFESAKKSIDAEFATVQHLTSSSITPRSSSAWPNPAPAHLVSSSARHWTQAWPCAAAPPALSTPPSSHPVLADSPDGGPSVYYCIDQIEAEEQRLLARAHQRRRAQAQLRGLDQLHQRVAARHLPHRRRRRAPHPHPPRPPHSSPPAPPRSPSSTPTSNAASSPAHPRARSLQQGTRSLQLLRLARPPRPASHHRRLLARPAGRLRRQAQRRRRRLHQPRPLRRAAHGLA